MAALQPQPSDLARVDAQASRNSSLSRIKSTLLRPSLTSHYLCTIQPPNTDFFQDRKVDLSPTKMYDKLSLPCVEASLPGSSLLTNEINDDHTGVTERQAYRRQYDDRVDFTFYVTTDDLANDSYYAIKFFEAWMGYAANEQYGDANRISSNNYTYRVNFPDDYCTGGVNGGTMSIRKFERDYAVSGKSLVYNFVRAFPVSINSMPVSYDSSELLKCTVSFSYSRYWIEQFILTESATSNAGSTPTTTPNTTRTTTGDTVAELQAMQEASRLRRGGFNAISTPGGTTPIAVDGRPLYQ